MPRSNKAERQVYEAQYRAAHREERNAYARAWSAANPRDRRAYYASYRYGLTPDALLSLLAQQENRCAICQVEFASAGEWPRSGTFHVDHCHACDGMDREGSIRGLLCPPCNLLHNGDDLDYLRKRIAYLERHLAVCSALN